MQEWEYRSITIIWNEESGDWRQSDKDDLRGIDAILGYYGAQSYELISITPEYWRDIARHGRGKSSLWTTR